MCGHSWTTIIMSPLTRANFNTTMNKLERGVTGDSAVQGFSLDGWMRATVDIRSSLLYNPCLNVKWVEEEGAKGYNIRGMIKKFSASPWSKGGKSNIQIFILSTIFHENMHKVSSHCLSLFASNALWKLVRVKKTTKWTKHKQVLCSSVCRKKEQYQRKFTKHGQITWCWLLFVFYHKEMSCSFQARKGEHWRWPSVKPPQNFIPWWSRGGHSPHSLR
jgi:hypothetical protein